MLALPQEYINSLCEIKSMTNELLAVGRIIKIDVEALEIAAQDDSRMPLLQYRTSVKLFVHNSRLDTKVIAGVVYLSTENFTRIEEVKSLQDYERRKAFRVNSHVIGILHPLLSEAEQLAFDAKIAAATPEEGEKLLESVQIEARLLDISLTGLRITSPVPLRKGARYIIEFMPITTPMNFCIHVQRIIKTPSGETQYGCSFYDYGERQVDMLCKELFQLQRIEKNRRRNAPV